MAKKAALGKGIASLLGGSGGEAIQENVTSEKKMPFPPKHIRSGKNIGNRVVVNPQKEAGSIEPAEVSIDKIKENPYQPRKVFKDQDLLDLSKSIRENGVIQPLIVSKKDNHYELIAGERRLRASKLAGLSTVPVVIKKATDRDRLVMAIIENVQRSDLNCVEEAYAYFKLMDEFHLTQEEVAVRVGKERSSVANFLRILKLPRKIIEFLQKELLSLGHAKVLSGVKDSDEMVVFAEETVAKKLSVRDLENLIKMNAVRNAGKRNGEVFIDDERDQLRQKLERKTGFHIQLKDKANGSGMLLIKYGTEKEFHNIYEYLMNK